MTRINEKIRAPQVRVIYQEINLVLATKKALAKAKELGLDLVEIAPNAEPPVCRIVDYGKYKYDQSKQKKATPKHVVKVKEVKFRVRIEQHDYNIKMTRAEDFLDEGDKLRIQLQFRGRENAHKELGFELMQRVKEDLKTMAKVDIEPKLNGKQIIMMMSPLPTSQRVRKFRAEIPEDYRDDDEEEDNGAHEGEEHAEENGAEPAGEASASQEGERQDQVPEAEMA